MRISQAEFKPGDFSFTIAPNPSQGVNLSLFLPVDAPVAGKVLKTNDADPTLLEWADYVSNAGGGGTVTSVGLSLPVEFEISNSPVTVSGTLTGGWTPQLQNKVLAAPASATGVPSFRVLDPDDIPNLNATKITTGTLSVSRLPIGTGATNVAAGNDARFHLQNTDIGTNSTTFQLDALGSGVKLKNNGGILELRNAADSEFAVMRLDSFLLTGASQTIETTELLVEDNLITLNSGAVDPPTENAGIEVDRGGVEANAILQFNETSDRWESGTVGATASIARVVTIAFTPGDFTSGVVTIAHNLNTFDVTYHVWLSDSKDFYPAGELVTANSIELDFGTGNSATGKVVVVG